MSLMPRPDNLIGKPLKVPKREITVEEKQGRELVQKYFTEGNLTEVEMMELKAQGMRETMQGKAGLSLLADEIEKQIWKEEGGQVLQELKVQGVADAYYKVLGFSKLDWGSLIIAIGLIVAIGGYFLPRFTSFLNRSRRASFLFFIGGLGVIWVLTKGALW